MKIISILKQLFIPHEGNDHRPHILRQESSKFIFIIILLAEAAFFASVAPINTKTNYYAAVLSSALVEMANSSRIDNQTPALKENMLLAAAAKLKAEDMAKRGYFAHNSPDGITPWYWLDKVGYTYSYAGENLAINFFDSQDVNNAWMNSPSHRANILSNKYSEMGIGIASGAYQGRETTFIVEFFGRPQVAKATVLDNPKPITLAIATTTLTKAPIATTSSATITDSKIVAAVKGESISNIGFSTWLFASPHTLMDWFYFGVAALIIISLMLAFFIKIKIQHPAILLNGLVLLLIVMIFIIINRYVAFNQTQIF